MQYRTTTAVGVVIFKRKEKAETLYKILKEVQPKKLFIIADGPRNKAETEACEETRKVFENIEWPCTVFRNYSDKNMGCCKRPYTGFNWVFENVDEAILLEDDCIPTVDFFRFCDQMLERYRYDTRIMQICGTNLLGKWDCDEDSYFFAQWASCWGWASWSRAWKLYDLQMSAWNNNRVQELMKQRLGSQIFKIRKPVFDEHSKMGEELSAWDHQWSFARTINSGLSITPSVNLVSNIGFGEDATHTNDMSETHVMAYSLQFPLRHPQYIMPDIKFDLEMAKMVYNARPLYEKVIRKIKRTFHI